MARSITQDRTASADAEQTEVVRQEEAIVPNEELSDVLSEFARTMVTDFPIQGILDHLVKRIVGIMPITAAGVTLIGPGLEPRYVAAPNEAGSRYEELPTSLEEGPCLAAYHAGEAVSVPDLRSEARFPEFAPRALAAGLGAVFTFPLYHGDLRLGPLTCTETRWETCPPKTSRRPRRLPMSPPPT
jgi:hypothetical protein